MKRFLFLLHRWLGVVLGLFMLLWCFSGLVMLYAGPAATSLEQRLANAETLRPEAGWLNVGAAWSKGGPKERPSPTIASAQLVRQGGEPIWLLQDNHGGRYALSARDGSARTTTPDRALSIARHWGGADAKPSLLDTTERDAATAMMTYDPFRPFHRIALNDAAWTELYVSARTGDVVRVSTRLDRILFWGGSYLHFLRPLDAIGLGSVRKDVLTWGALAACCAALSGLWVGLSRWRPGWFSAKRYADGRSNPYRAFWPRWHLWLGLGGGLLALTWAFSGFLSNNPWQLFNTGHMTHRHHEQVRYQGGPLPQAVQDMPMDQLQGALRSASGTDTVELSWQHLGGRAALLAYDRSGQHHVVLRQPAAGNAVQSSVPFDQPSVLAAAARLQPGTHIRAYQWLTDYDRYYYHQWKQPASERPLPVLRVELGDAASTWLYLDPATGAMVAKLDRSARVFRWLFRGLHTWDMGWLAERPLWDIWMVSGSLIGLALALTSVILGWRRSQRKIAGMVAKARQPRPADCITRPESR